MRKLIETIFAKNFATNYEKKVLGTLDAWSMSHLSQPPSKPGYYIKDFWISRGHVDQFSTKMLPTWIH